jgi:hypothetical protein
LPLNYDGNDFANDSTALVGIDLMVHFPGSDIGYSAKTDEAGIATINNLQEGNYEVVLDIPGDSARFTTFFGTDDGFEPRQHENQDTNHPIVYLGPDEQLNGTFYVQPYEDGGAEQNLSSVQISVLALPAGYTGSNYTDDSAPMAGIEVTVAIPGSEFALTTETDSSGLAAFGGLGEGNYQHFLGIPAHAADFVPYFGTEGEIEPRPVDGQDSNAPTVYLNANELLYGSFYVIPVDAGAEPTATPGNVDGEPVTDLPNTGAGDEASDSSGWGIEIALALTALISLLTLGAAATRQRA